MRKFDIQVNMTVVAEDEAEAEHIVRGHLRAAEQTVSTPELVGWEFIEYVPVEQELAKACCC